MEREESLTRFTQVFFILAILSMSIIIFLKLNNPQEEYVQFFLLNKDKKLGDYQTTTQVGENYTFYFAVECYYEQPHNFSVRIKIGDNMTKIDRTLGAINASLESFQNKTLQAYEKWVSDPCIVVFKEKGEYILILELWMEQSNGEWEFLENQVLTLHISVIV